MLAFEKVKKLTKAKVRKEESTTLTTILKKVFVSDNELDQALFAKKRRTTTIDQKAELAVRKKGLVPSTTTVFLNDLQL